MRRMLFLAAMLGALLALSGCATGFLLDNTVQSHSRIGALPPQPTFRFERLPSQQVAPVDQAALEAMAEPALLAAGLRRDDNAPHFAVEVSLREYQMLSPYADPMWGGWGWGMAYGPQGYGVGVGLGGPLYPRMDQIWLHREVGVVLRDLGSQAVVYETHAYNDGPWLDGRAVLPAMFQAAMQGFPNPPAGARRVDIHVGG